MVTSSRPADRMLRNKCLLVAVSVAALVAAESACAQSAPVISASPQGNAPASDASAQGNAPAAGADAQGNPPAAEIVVTGSQIRGVAPLGAPVMRLDRSEIEESGLVSTSDILHTLPQVSSLGASTVYGGTNENASLNTDRDASINIRGLQPQATLVLLDGRRTPIGGTTGQLYDPSSIPAIALSGIDILTGGASATYGSDAVAGVANLTLRKNFNGLEAQATYGAGIGFHTQNYDGIFGHKWSGGSLMIAYEYSSGSELLDTARPNLYACAPNGVNACSLFNPTYGNVKLGTTYYSVPVTSTGTGITRAQLTPGATYFNTPQDSAILPKTERNSVVWNLQQDVISDVHLWTEGYFTAKTNSFREGQLSLSGPIGPQNPGYIPTTGSETAYTSLDGTVGPALRTGLERAYQIAGGADITLPHDWAFNAYGEHNYNFERVDTSGLNSAADAAALGCATPGLCFDPFGPNPSNASAITQMVGESYTNYWQKEDVFDAKFDGPLFTLPGGQVKLAVGGEIQHNTLRVLSDNTTASPSVSVLHIAGNFTSGRTIKSVYGEAVIPIVGENNRLPLVQSLIIDAAGRYDHYSDVGSTANPKVSFNWKPISDLAVRGEYGTSFRAPTLCDTNPDCTGTVMSTTTGYPGYDALILLGGNTSVKPETATTYDFGITYKPVRFSGLTLTADYYSINYKNVIATPGFGITAAQFNSAIYSPLVNKNPSAAYLQYLEAQPWFVAPTTFNVNNPGAPLAIINGERFNSGQIITKGIDFSADYALKNSWGAWDAGIAGTYVLTYKYSVFPGLPLVEELDTVNYPTRWRFRAKASWSAHNLTTVAYVNYTGAYINNTGTDGLPLNTPVHAYATIDLTMLYKVPASDMLGGVANNVTISVSAINVTNAQPPYVLTATAQEFDAQEASPLGRVVNISLKKAF